MKALRYSAAFDIGAQAYVGLYEIDEAQGAYRQTLECEGVWEDSIRLNQAIVFNRQSEYSSARSTVSKISDVGLWLHKTEVEIRALIGLELLDQAERLADAVLSFEEYPDSDLISDVNLDKLESIDVSKTISVETKIGDSRPLSQYLSEEMEDGVSAMN